MRRPQEWLGVAAAASVVLLSLSLAAWTLRVGSRAADDVPAVASASGGKRGTFDPRFGTDPQALAIAERSDDVLVGLSAPPGGPIEVLAIPSDGSVLPPGSLRATVGGTPAQALEQTSCGTNCLRLALPALSGTPLTVAIEVLRPGRPAASVSFPLPDRLPPSGNPLLRSVERVMGDLQSLRVDETLTPGTELLIRTRYELRAPDRVAITSSTGGKTLLIGLRRWDLEGGQWVESPFPGVRVPTYIWEGAGHARLLGEASVDGVSVHVLGLFKPDPQLPAWFRLSVDDEGRVLEAQMLAQGHFMTERLGGFGEPLTIEPPA